MRLERWSDIFQEHHETPFREGQSECIFVEILPIPPILPRADGHAEMDWALVCDQEAHAGLLDGPVAELHKRIP